MARSALAALAGFVLAARPGRCAPQHGVKKYPDDEVQASQRYFSVAWRDHYNQNKVARCGEAYLDGAALHVNFGPLATQYKKEFGWSSPLVARGRENITTFWTTIAEKGAFKNLRAHEDSGDTSSTALVVDDDTVIVEGRFASDEASGRILSETWIRQGAEWKLRSAMWEIEGSGSPVAVAAEELATALEEVTTPKEEQGVETQEEARKRMRLMMKGLFRKEADVQSQGKEAAPASATAGKAALGTLGIFGGLTALFFVRRASNRKKYSVGGFEAFG